MKKIRLAILVLILLLAVGFAAVSTILVLNGTAIFGTNDDDFDVIFTKSIIDGIDASDTTISEDGKTITFETKDLAKVDDESVLNFTVTNNSTQYDANVTMECIAEGENADYYEITNTIPSVIVAKSSKDGSVTARLKKVSVNEISETFTCTITASAVERTEEGVIPVKTYAVGELVTIAGETFNVMRDNGDTVTMLASNNLGTDYRQSELVNEVVFSTEWEWDAYPGPKEIDIQVWATNPKTYVNEYVSFLKTETGDTSLTGDLITINELGQLGCTIQEDYSWTGVEECTNSKNASWLLNNQDWWTQSAQPADMGIVWVVWTDGHLEEDYFSSSNGVRPVITISKDVLE